jgi:small Trp-rich protein
MAMWLVGLGLLQIVLHLAGVGFMAAWNWDLMGDLWKFAWPFACAIVWWTWADQSGYNKRREMEQMELRKQTRRARNLATLGLDPKGRRKKQS